MAQPAFFNSTNRHSPSALRAAGRSAGTGESRRKYPASEFLIPPPVDDDSPLLGMPLEALLAEEDFPSDLEVGE